MLLPGKNLNPGCQNTSSTCQNAALTLPAVFLLIALGLSLFLIHNPASADGGGAQPTNTALPGIQIVITPTNPEGVQSTPPLIIGTPEVKSFEIVIDSDQNATVLEVTPADQAVLSRIEALEAQGNSPTQPEEFTSPLWVFGFITLVVLIVILNAVGRGLRNRA